MDMGYYVDVQQEGQIQNPPAANIQYPLYPIRHTPKIKSSWYRWFSLGPNRGLILESNPLHTHLQTTTNNF